MSDERRQMAETIKQTSEMLEMAAVNAPTLFPGEPGRSFAEAWMQPDSANSDLQQIANELITVPPPQYLDDESLQHRGLVGPSGDLKRQFLSQQRDQVLRFLRPETYYTNSEDYLKIKFSLVSRSEMKNGCEALGEYFEGAATLVRSIAPHGDKVVELLSYAKQLSKFGAKLLGRG
jgi:hypothetical protein